MTDKPGLAPLARTRPIILTPGISRRVKDGRALGRFQCLLHKPADGLRAGRLWLGLRCCPGVYCSDLRRLKSDADIQPLARRLRSPSLLCRHSYLRAHVNRVGTMMAEREGGSSTPGLTETDP